MIFKYYTFELTVFDGSEQQIGIALGKFYRWENPVNCLIKMKNKIKDDGFGNHKIKSMKRIK